MSFEDSIIWQNSGKINNYDFIGESNGTREQFTQNQVTLTPPDAIIQRLIAPVNPPFAIGLWKLFPPAEDIYFSQWRMIPSEPNQPISWISILKMWESWRTNGGSVRHNHTITCAINSDLELSGRGNYETVPNTGVGFKTFEWWTSLAKISLNEWFRLMVYIKKHETQGIVTWWLNDEEIFHIENLKTHFPAATKFYSDVHTYYSTGEIRLKDVITYTDETVAARQYVPLNYRVGEAPPTPPITLIQLPFALGLMGIMEGVR